MFRKRSIRRIGIIFHTVLLLTIQGCTFAGKPAKKVEPIDNTYSGLHIEETTVDIEGMDDSFDIFFLADSHISKCDDRDRALMTKAAQRSLMFQKDGIDSWDRFDMLIEESRNRDTDLVIMGGDIVDSAMYASIDHVRDRIATLNLHMFQITFIMPEEKIDEWISPDSKPEDILPYALTDMIMEKATGNEDKDEPKGFVFLDNYK
jgi:hypothetical protein